MKTFLFRSKTVLLGAALLTYTIWLFVNGLSVWVTEAWTTAGLAVCAFVGLYLIAIIAFPSLMPTNRWSIGLLWIGLVWFAHAFLRDNPAQMVYIADVVKLLWVFLIIAGPTKLLMTNKMEQEIADKNVEIIEV